jgi:heme/copper-type cytochrome/quinol oxidase subunit 3
MTNSASLRRAPSPSGLARQFFLLSVGLLSLAGGLGWILGRLGNRGLAIAGLNLPWAFGVSTAALVVGSRALHNALFYVRREKQLSFRRSLLAALGAGTLFVGVQSYGLWCWLQDQTPGEAETGVNAFVFVLAALHGLHFIVALLFLVYVTLHGFADCYDHEYYRGVVVCTFFWHALGVVWACILAVLAIAVLAAG